MANPLHFLPPSVPLLLLLSSLPHDICATFWIPSSHSLHSLANNFCPGAAIRQNNGAIRKENCQVTKSSIKKAVEKVIFLYLYCWLTTPMAGLMHAFPILKKKPRSLKASTLEGNPELEGMNIVVMLRSWLVLFQINMAENWWTCIPQTLTFSSQNSCFLLCCFLFCIIPYEPHYCSLEGFEHSQKEAQG